MKRLVKKSLMLLAGVLMLASACNKLPVSEETGIATGKGTVVLKLTDAPFPVSLVDKALVTIDKIEIRSAAPVSATEEEDNNEALYTVISTKTQEFNLLDLQNGITATLIEINIPVGSYDLIRMHVVAANIILKDGKEFPMKIPGGSESGLKLKLNPVLVVASGVAHEVLLDFNVSKSFITQGNMKSKNGIKGFIFKPVIRAVVEKHSGRVRGKVFENEKTPIVEAHVQILSGTEVLSSALTDKEGEYAIIGVPPGEYTMVCEKDGYTKVTIEKVIVKEKENTTENFKMVKPI